MAVHEAAAAFISAGTTDSDISLSRQPNLTPIEKVNDPMHLARSASGDYQQWLNSEIMQVLDEHIDD